MFCKQVGQLFQVLMLCLQKSPKKQLWLVLPDEICFISSSYLCWSILYSKAAKSVCYETDGTRIKDMISQDEISNFIF